MYIEKEISLYDFVNAISEVVDLILPAVNSHHKMVACIACRIAQEMKLPAEDIQNIILASMLHDIGAFSVGERIKTLSIDTDETEMNRHALLGYELLKNFEPLADAARLIKYHHTDFDISKPDIPLGSCIIHLADRAVVLLNDRREVLSQIPEMLEKIAVKYHKFHPDVFASFVRLSRLEYFWIEALSPSFGTVMLKKVLSSKKIIDLETLRSYTRVFAQIIDFKSRFTAAHSRGVAAVARELTVIFGFSERECKLMEIAGLLHDLGKMAVSNEILEKKGKLNRDELNAIRKHTYYTYAALSRIGGLEQAAIWAAHHHERPDGNGYPFHVKGEDFSKLARIMAAADVTTALTEDRPYRPGMERDKALEVLSVMAEDGGLDKKIVETINEHFLRINDVRISAQQEAKKEYEAFYNITPLLFAENTKQSA